MPTLRHPKKKHWTSFTCSEKQLATKKRKKQTQKVVALDEDGNEYFEAEAVVGKRVKNGIVEWEVQWKGFAETTWEPDENLCDSLHEKAREFGSGKSEQRLLNLEDNGESDDTESDADSSKGATVAESSKGAAVRGHLKPPPAFSNRPPGPSKESPLNFMEIERIHVSDPKASENITQARQNGVPVCVVGHKGWAQFAKKWVMGAEDFDLLDLSENHELNLDKIRELVGHEEVPVVKRHYNEQKPISESILLSRFLDTSWPKAKSASKLYLHQWQFPLSETAFPVMCGKNDHVPLPNGILGEDLLQFWLDHDVSPLQYIFMGAPDTVSKLHKDNGGLLITIAPIVGKKEVTLVHRADGTQCLYQLEVDVENPDVDVYPLSKFARIWKSVLVPGEILIMPAGTYHQCRNVTPCLSFSKFHLDHVNLIPFLQSLIDQDAPELEHESILWNAAHKLADVVDNFTDNVDKKGQDIPVPDKVQKAVFALGHIRSVMREIDRIQKSTTLHKLDMDYTWFKLVTDTDETLHDFRYRGKKKPTFRAEQPFVNIVRQPAIASDDSSSEDEAKARAFRKVPPEDRAIRDATRLPANLRHVTISDSVSLSAGDSVSVIICGRSLDGQIVEVADYLEAAFVEFFDFPPTHSEYLPVQDLRVKPAMDCFQTLSSGSLRTDMCVYVLHRGQEYQARVKNWRFGTFYLVKIPLKRSLEITRWFSRAEISSKSQSTASSPANAATTTTQVACATSEKSGEGSNGNIPNDVASPLAWLPPDAAFAPI